MGAQTIQPDTIDEKLIYWTIVGTWGLWLLGALYIAGPALGYILVLLILARVLGLVDGATQELRIPFGVVLWIAGMLAMLVALIIAHIDFELGLAQTVKSTIGWMKGWALLAVFVLAGATLQVRAELVYRATGNLALQTLVLAPLFFTAGMIGIPPDLYVSPLQIVGGPGPEFFDVTLYGRDDTQGGKLRWRFFGPWSTAVAFLAGIWFVFALYEKSRHWKIIGITSAVVVCWMAGSRLSLVAVPLIVLIVLGVSNVRKPMVLGALAIAASIGVLLMDDVVMAYQDMNEAFTSARAASSRVRATLASIAYHRWMTEAPIFGHGVVESGPHLVQFMKIGSHHTWHGLLFVKGVVGFLGLAIPLAWSILELSLKAQMDRVARAGLGVMLAFLLFSFGDNIEIVAYLVWPGMLLVGIAMRRRFRSPYRERMGLLPA